MKIHLCTITSEFVSFINNYQVVIVMLGYFMQAAGGGYFVIM